MGMLAIFNNEMVAAEQGAVADGMSMHTMMQNAGRAVKDVVTSRFPRSEVLVLCGPGNNGGDALVVARLLMDEGWPVSVFCDSNSSQDMVILKPRGLEHVFSEDMARYGVIIDGIFGSGLARNIEDDGLVRLFRFINGQRAAVISIDIPSGVDGNSGAVCGVAVKADITVTFNAYKVGHLLFPGRCNSGEVIVADIGIGRKFFADSKSVNEPSLWLNELPVLDYSSHKYSRGHLCIVGGSMSGAAILSAMAGQRCSAGIVTVVVPSDALHRYSALPPSVIVASKLPHDRKISSVVVGPGLGKGEREKVFEALSLGVSCVIDADALNAFAGDSDDLFGRFQGPKHVLTPHMGEFVRLFPGINVSNKVQAAMEAAKVANSVIVLKGADTVIACPSGMATINNNAGYGLSTAGSGDVLSGVVGSLIASGMPPFWAASAAVWIHGATSSDYMTAEDICCRLPDAMQQIADKKNLAHCIA